MIRHSLTVAGDRYYMAQGLEIAELRRLVISAVRGGGDIVDVTLVGNRSIGILVSPGLHLVIDSAEVPEDDRDDGDQAYPFDPDIMDGLI